LFTFLIFKESLPTWALFAEFVLAGALVIVAGSRFTKAADELGKRLGIASGWIGLILLATVTSLPELVSGATATWIGNVDLALGGIFGSCSFNITLIVLLNAMWGGGSVLRRVSPAHVLTSSFGVALISMALLGLVTLEKLNAKPQLAQTCEIVWALLIAVTYLWCMRLTYRFERTLHAPSDGEDSGARRSVGAALYGRLFLMAVTIVAASWWLARLGDTLSTHRIEMIGRPLGATFVGAAFLALATSLPELATSVTAVRLGNLDLALGNIFGSNMFNIFVIPFLKLVSVFSGESRLISAQTSDSLQNLIVGLLAIILMTVALGGLTYKSERRLLRRFGFDSILIAVGYVGGMTLLLICAN